MLKKLSALSLFFLLLSASPAFAEGQAYDQRDAELKIRAGMGMPAAWFACKTSDECVSVDLPCGPSLGVRTDRKAEAEATICKDTKNCPASCNSSAVTTPYAICKDGECWADYSRR